MRTGCASESSAFICSLVPPFRPDRVSLHRTSLAPHRVRPRVARRRGRPVKGSVASLREIAVPVTLVVAGAAALYAIVAANRRSVSASDGLKERYAADRGRRATERQFEAPGVPVQKGVVLREFAHDLHAFTQGLSWSDGELFESTGMRGSSSVRRIDSKSGAVNKIVEIGSADFGEGCCVVGKGDQAELLQLLWKTGVGNVFSLPEMKLQRTFTFEPDGWGLARDAGNDRILYLSDGTEVIRVMRRVIGANGETVGIEEVRRFEVRVGGKSGSKVMLLNELEVVRGQLWANIWMSELVARIDIDTGFVVGWIDLRNILDRESIPAGHRVDVLNGIAWDQELDRVLVTGKMWPKMFEIEVASEVSSWSLKFINTFFTDPARVRLIMKSTEGV